ncbi:zinc transporter ZIP1-like [Anolis carolinensis]|uniref:zinc transporter ZIP1-like n=1 Tax=Anolis carolinensis TaxID=28377 RepID=UPI002F2B8544
MAGVAPPLLGLKAGCLVALALVPLLCGILPAAILLRRRLQASPSAGAGIRGLLSCAAGGVFLAACLLDIVPDSLEDLRLQTPRLSPDFPLPELILALGFLLVLVVEHVLLDCSEGGPGPDAASEPLLSDPESDVPLSSSSPFRALVLTLSLCLHSTFEGLALGLQESAARLLRLAGAVLLHKAAMALSLSLLLLAQSRLPLRWALVALTAFALASPLGLGLGLVLTLQDPSSPSPESGVRSVLQGVAAGTFLYITFLEVLPQELHSPSMAPGRLPRVLALLLGFSAMAALRLLG